MIAILLFHTEIYYTGDSIIPYIIYVCNALSIFFFISGYLFYKEESCFNIKHKLKSIARYIVLPYFIFTSVIAFPKALVHNQPIDLEIIIINILNGNASWFVSALIVAEIIFSILVFLIEKFIDNNNGKYIILSTIVIIMFVIGTAYRYNIFSIDKTLYDSLIALIFIYIGYVYHHYEKNYIRIQQKTITIFFSSLILIALKIYELYSNCNLTVDMPNVSNYPLLILDSTLGFIMMKSIAEKFNLLKLISWTGSHCLVYYFLCGGVPLLVSLLLNKIGLKYTGCYLSVILALIIVYIISTLMTWFIYRYIPFVIGRKYERNNII